MCIAHDTILGIGVFVEGKKLEKYFVDMIE